MDNLITCKVEFIFISTKNCNPHTHRKGNENHSDCQSELEIILNNSKFNNKFGILYQHSKYFV